MLKSSSKAGFADIFGTNGEDNDQDYKLQVQMAFCPCKKVSASRHDVPKNAHR